MIAWHLFVITVRRNASLSLQVASVLSLGFLQRLRLRCVCLPILLPSTEHLQVTSFRSERLLGQVGEARRVLLLHLMLLLQRRLLGLDHAGAGLLALRAAIRLARNCKMDIVRAYSFGAGAFAFFICPCAIAS